MKGNALGQLSTSAETDSIEIAFFGIDVYLSATMYDKHGLAKGNLKLKAKSH